jgi:hypothetical protein
LLILASAVASWADSGAPGYPDDPLRPMQTTRDILIYVQMRPAVGPPIPVISITPAGTNPQAKIKVESAIPEIVDYYFFYRGTHPYSVASNLIDEWRDTIRTLNVADPSNNFFIDINGGIGNSVNNYCYWARAVDAVDPLDHSTWLLSAPSNVVCDWDYPLFATAGMAHWNQVAIPVSNPVTDTLGGWMERKADSSMEVDQWMPASQSWSPRAIKINGAYTLGRNRTTRYEHPYNFNVKTATAPNNVLSLWGNRIADTCDNLYSNASLNDLNHVMIQPAWHWFQDDSSSRFEMWGQKFYNGLPTYDYGVREVLEWSGSSQSYTSRTLWNGTIWTSRSGVKVYRPFMVNRTYNYIPGGTASPICWPPLMAR